MIKETFFTHVHPNAKKRWRGTPMKITLNQSNYHDFSVYEVNKLPGRSYFIPYPARAEADKVSPKEKRYRSSKVLCLNGDWDFKFYPIPSDLPEDFDTDQVKSLTAS